MDLMNRGIGWDYSTPGIPDSWFVRRQVPITKAEVRSVTLSKARLKRHSTIYDIGAGTGSISIEAALLAPRGRVFAIEKNPAALELIRENAARFGVGNLKVIEGEAPGVLGDLPSADRVIIGGSGGKLRSILHVAGEKLQDGGRVVISSITLETFCTSLEALPREGLRVVDICCVTVARVTGIDEPGADIAVVPGLGESSGQHAGIRMWRGLNPVYIITAVKGEKR